MIRFLPIVAIVFLIIEVIFINQLAGMGEKVSAYDVAIDKLQEENALLEQAVASASSLLLIEQKAKEYGFTESHPTSYIHLDDELPLALKESQ
ncbi:MAG: hypothetical protein ACD_51C00317G0002 [uncultured bacterium]|uniref:Uncharacterized protein n=1 Tax=Candidatus Gottesmanbacteria bacterium RIFCSPLOWO2_01_FULL_43_11b TaxID=1798392 RepID=A0A1F6AJF1_9BACT|nr:MAG: hypothetical protein ACD_51C00317G0002 [uncultured bacterium]OGG24553.1 MAG: hypothetical protein A3A79_05205 [Candidatus Gottesmanbacteria bacterium RIFCSPLOWO2_01_FULL_43_11b]